MLATRRSNYGAANTTRYCLLAVCIVALAAAPAFGATDTLFTAGVTQVTTVLTGSGGILITLVAILAASIANRFFTAVL